MQSNAMQRNGDLLDSGQLTAATAAAAGKQKKGRSFPCSIRANKKHKQNKSIVTTAPAAAAATAPRHHLQVLHEVDTSSASSDLLPRIL